MSAKLVLNMPAIARLEKAGIRALEQTGQWLHSEIVQAQVIPRDTGALQNQKTYVDTSESSKGTVSIVHEGPYARRLFYHPEYNFSTTENPNAKGHWTEDWEPGGSKAPALRKAFKTFYKKESGL